MLRLLKINFLMVFAAILVTDAMPLQAAVVQNVNQVSQFGITWTFDKSYPVGQFANGDYWVGGPVTIVGINPPSTNVGGRTKNGSMVNPSPSSTAKNQGYDSTMSGDPYNAILNKALDVSASNPLVLQSGSSLISTISIDSAGARPQLQTAAVLTVLNAAPPTGSFRPPYSGTDKTIRYNKSQLNYSLLANLAPVDKTHALADVERYFERPWIDHIGTYTGEYAHPLDNQPNYGRDCAVQVGIGALMLHLNFTNSQKETLLVRYVQMGIDLYGVVQNGGTNMWYPDGGHFHGKEWPIIFAGLMLNDAGMKNVGAKSGDYLDSNGYKAGDPPPDYIRFSEVGQTFYVRETSPGVYNYGHGGYTAADVGLPEWSYGHARDLSTDNKKWAYSQGDDISLTYRRSGSAESWAGFILAAHIMNATEFWNHKVIFDYQDRFMEIELPHKGEEYTRQWDLFTENMWDTYRANYGCVWTRSNPSDTYSNGSNGCDPNAPKGPRSDAGPNQTLTDSGNNGSEQVTLNGSNSSDSDGSIVSYIWTEGSTQIAVGAEPIVTLPVGQHTIMLEVTDNDGLTDTDTVVVAIEPPDTTPPSILSVAASDISVEVQFNEALDESSADNPANYNLSDGLSISSVQVDSELNRVTLYTNVSHQEGVTYTLTVHNIKDVAGNVMSQTIRNYTYTEGLVGHWVFNSSSGNSVADISGNNNTGTLLNGTQLTSAGEASFDGANDCVQIPTNSWHTNEGTVALWAYATDFSGGKYFFGHNVGSWTNTIQLYANGGALCVGLGGNHTLATNIKNLSTNIWYHITLTWDGTNYTVYVDGTAVKSGSYPALTTLNSTADIGNTGNSSSRNNEAFKGFIDEVRVYNKALTATEISDLALVFLPIGDKTVAEGNQLTFSVRTKPGVTVKLWDQNLPSMPTFVSNVFNWTPDYGNNGVYEVEFTAPHGTATDFEKISITVTNSPWEYPIGHWTFDETSGDIAYDSSATGNNGQIKNGLVWDTGRINGALAFSVPNDAVEIQTTNFNTRTGTIAMWVYVEKQTLSRHYLFGYENEALQNRIQLYLKYGNLCLGLGNSYELYKNPIPLQNQRWYHVALVWDNTTYRIFVNGSARIVGGFSGLTGFDGHADIGNNGIYRDKALNGKIDDVRIYNRALSASEIAELANQ